jgi:hypothetical protein
MASPLAPIDPQVGQNPEALRVASLAPRPTRLAQTGLSVNFLADLIGKHLANAGVVSLSELIERLALAGPIVDQVLQWMRKEGRVEIRARTGADGDLNYGLTERGRMAALDARMRDGYVGPAPVPLQDYAAVVRKQSVHDRNITRQEMLAAFQHVVIDGSTLDQLGPALNSGRAIFIYGAAGTGKTFIAKKLADAIGGRVLIPYAIAVSEVVVQIFDPLAHVDQEFCDAPSPLMLEYGYDRRYALCERPIVVTGGELTPEMLEIQCDPTTREYRAPLQLKANNGLLLIDDLGRQRISPEKLFNRWIVPMEEKQDYLSAGPGQHFLAPFDLVLVFSTNLNPLELADEAFLRRVGYKIAFKRISSERYRQIWANVCAECNVYCEPALVDYVIHDLHAQRGVPLLPCHPRDLLGMAMDRLRYVNAADELDQETLLWAWNNYFVEVAKV